LNTAYHLYDIFQVIFLVPESYDFIQNYDSRFKESLDSWFECCFDNLE